MSEVTALVCRYSADETPHAEGATILAFDVEDYATRVNAWITTQGPRPLLMLDRAYMEPSWIDPMLAELAITKGIVSPYFRTGLKAIKWFDQILPGAWMIQADVLHQLGGLQQDMLFCQSQVVEYRARRAHLKMTAVADATAAPAFSPQQLARTGALYYRQIEDERRVQQINGGT